MRRRPRPTWRVVVPTAVVGLLVGVVVGVLAGRATAPSGAPVARGDAPVLSPAEALAVAEAIGPILPPTSCPFREDPALLPNAARDYRGGVHQGIDFGCDEPGAAVVAPLDGRVLVAAHGYQDPTPEDRQALLDFARSQGDTPPWTLVALYGRFVVLDHGAIEGAGHVVTIYAHLDEIDPAVQPGVVVAAGTRIGAVGHSGTSAGATGEDRGYELHWELHVDDAFLAEGLTPEESAAPYRALFAG